MLSTIKTRGIERYDDLHVDQVDQHWRPRKHWISGGLEALQVAIELRESHRIPVGVALGCSLHAEGVTSWPALTSMQELSNQLDWSPPSLYLFHKGKEPWREAGSVATFLPKLLSEIEGRKRGTSKLEIKHCYFIEFSQNGERHRSVFAAG